MIEDQVCIISVVGNHAGETLSDIFKRKMEDIKKTGFTFWTLVSYKARPNMIQELMKKDSELNVYFVESKVENKNLKNNTVSNNKAKYYSLDKKVWCKISDDISDVSGKINTFTTCLMLKSLKLVDDIIDIDEFKDFLDNKKINIRIGCSTVCALRDTNNKIVENNRRVIAVGKLFYPGGVWVNQGGICSSCKEVSWMYGKKVVCYKCYMNSFNQTNYKRNREKIKEQTSKYYYDNHDERKRQRRESQKTNLNYKKYQKEYFKENRDVLVKKMNERYYGNRKEILKRQNIYRQNRLKTDIEYCLKETLSSRMRMAIMNHKGLKQSSAIELLGADIATVRKHIESQFKEGMTWENHNIVGWHVDHRVPCDAFDLTNKEEQKKCFHYTNLQPMRCKENIQKGNKF